jgi:uncharacterized protein YggE
MLALAPAAAPAQTQMPRPLIRVIGEATVSTQPDQARINIGVVTQASTAQGAAAQNADRSNALIAELRKMVGSSGTIKTVGYTLNPEYKYPPSGGTPTLTGYTASNTVQVETSDLTQVGKLIDAATKAGANNIQSLEFTLKDETAARTQALQQAALKAREKAKAILSALGIVLDHLRIVSVEEEGTPIIRPVEMAFKTRQESPAPTPVEPGAVEVRTSVVMTVTVGE